MNILKNLKKDNGITLMTLIITVIIIIILSTTTILNVDKYNATKRRTNFYTDIRKLKEEIDLYYSKNKQLPVSNQYVSSRLDIIEKSPNDGEDYYVIDLSKFDNLNLNYGKQFYQIEDKTQTISYYTDIYIINEESHTIYYPKGVKYNDKTWYTTMDVSDEEMGLPAIITYMANGGTGTMNKNAINVASNLFTPPTDMTFSKWNTSPDGTGTDYTPGQTVSQDTTLYAIWKTDYRLASVVSIGDYVAYDAGTATTYNSSDPKTYKSVKGTGSSHGNGNSDQTFLSSSSIKWRVLKIENDQVVLISEAPIGNLLLNGAIGYLYAEEEINRACSIYGHGTGADTSQTFTCQTGEELQGYDTVTLTGSGARSINIDDIDKICGITTDEQKKAIVAAYGTKHEIGNHYYPTKTKSDGKSSSAESRRETCTDYYYSGSTYLTNTDEEPYKMLFRNTANSDNITYWLASKSVDSRTVPVNFRVRFVGNGWIDSKWVCSGESGSITESYYDYGIRPVVYLQSTLRTSGKVNDEWQLQ